jgi:putative endonuclease
MTARAGLGRLGERLAAAHLEGQGYRLLARNVRLPPWGEIDLVAEKAGILVLVEVRLRRGERYGGPLGSISPAKRARMLNAARAYLLARGDEARPARIDVVGITLDGRGRLVGVEHVENAVEAAE